jgi:hypothetical protein
MLCIRWRTRPCAGSRTPTECLPLCQSAGDFAAFAIAGIVWTAVSPATAYFYLIAWMLLVLSGY